MAATSTKPEDKEPQFPASPDAAQPADRRLEYKRVIQGLDEGIKIAGQYKNTSELIKKQFAFNRFLYGSHFWQLPEFQNAQQTSSLIDALHLLTQRKDWQQKIKEKHHELNWLAKFEKVQK